MAKLTLRQFVDAELGEIDLLRMRAQRILRVPEEVFSDLCPAKSFAITFIPIDTAARFVKLDDGH